MGDPPKSSPPTGLRRYMLVLAVAWTAWRLWRASAKIAADGPGRLMALVETTDPELSRQLDVLGKRLKLLFDWS